MARTRRTRGRNPEAPWVCIGDFELEGVPWGVFLKPGEDWSGVKVCAQGRAASKANYWLAWNGQRFAHTAELAKAEGYRPAIIEHTRAVISSYTALDYL